MYLVRPRFRTFLYWKIIPRSQSDDSTEVISLTPTLFHIWRWLVIWSRVVTYHSGRWWRRKSVDPPFSYSGSTVLKKINVFTKIYITHGIFLCYVIIKVTVFLRDNVVINVILKENGRITVIFTKFSLKKESNFLIWFNICRCFTHIYWIRTLFNKRMGLHGIELTLSLFLFAT